MRFQIPLDKNFDIKIGSHNIKVKFVKPSELGKESDSIVYGEWSELTHTIKIKKNLPYSIKLDTLLHELSHCVETFYWVRFGSHKDLNLFATVMSQIILDNFTTKHK